jgi:DNA invertase Pin-like site-specific DNA recombinase
MMAHQLTPRHLQRLAYLYVRQSTLQQVFENTESTARQYALHERALALGWPSERIVVIDQDLGHSGASAADRAGFQRLVAEVGLGKVGLVLVLEVSRLARSSSDWHRLLEICALTGTLILDEDGLYDPATFNDRLLLGLKGTMSEAELYVLRARLQGGILNKARRAALKLHLPIGLCYSDDDRIILDPDRQVQDTLSFLFRTFERTASASATVRAFRLDQVPFPRRLRSGPHQGDLVWGEVRHDDILRILHNPAYAGAFVFGRTRTTKTADGKVHIASLPREEWQVVVREAHIGYISWEQYEAHLEQLAVNSRAYAPKRLSPPREGPALLQGLVICGLCGERMTVRYHQRGGQRIVPDYLCQRAGIQAGTTPCQRIPGRDLDQAIADVLMEVVTPETVLLTLRVQDELVAQAAEADRLRQLQVQRAQYEADLAQRRYLRVDPDNRLVADILEAEWNAKLQALAAAQEAAEQHRREAQAQVSAEERQRMQELLEDFPRFWRDPRTSAQERKRIARLVLEDVTVRKEEVIVAHVRFKGGAARTLRVPLPIPLMQSRLTSPETLAEIDRLLDEYTDAGVAEQLNGSGWHTFAGLPFTAGLVSALRRGHGLKSRSTRLREAGLLTAEELALQLGIRAQTVWKWYHRGLVEGVRSSDRGTCLFRLPEGAVPRRYTSSRLRRKTQRSEQ